jgi:uncharacterized protein
MLWILPAQNVSGGELAQMSTLVEKKRVPIREGIFTSLDAPLESVRLQGSKCRNCGEVAFGITTTCQNCSAEDTEIIPLSKDGFLWTYTVIRNRPPGDYKGPDPYVPFAEGLVELPEGIRILSPLGGDPEKVKIGMKLKLKIYKLYSDANGNDVIAWRFDPIEEVRP